MIVPDVTVAPPLSFTEAVSVATAPAFTGEAGVTARLVVVAVAANAEGADSPSSIATATHAGHTRRARIAMGTKKRRQGWQGNTRVIRGLVCGRSGTL